MKKILLFLFFLLVYQIAPAQLTCNNWLSTPSIQSFFRAGDLDIPGNKVTIEAVINRTQPYLPGGGNNTEGDVVSKHTDPNDVNYLLRPNHAYITTTNGFFGTPDVCEIELNKTYHVAMVYDGATLKFYRNGFLMSQVAATGNLIQNNFNTQIGLYAVPVFSTQFLGYINEVRIWNVARTQTEIMNFMNTSLPNPTTQPGLQAYYTFDNLLNKQGNPAWNGTLGGSATINSTVPVCNLVADYCPVSCSNWLSTPSIQSFFRVGDLDIPGNKVTVEAVINRTQPYLPGGGNNTEGDVVSKHTDPNDVNYLLRPNHAYITTTNGFFGTPDICDIELNKTYHVAMVYDGATLKFYRNGFLMSQVAATGNLIQNNFNTQVGLYAVPVFSTQFLGYTNEVRIWNVARTQTQIRSSMNSSLPNPTTQTGLLAYYTFDNLLNKQGNPAWNGTLGGTATINATNPNCAQIIDSCGVLLNATTIINTYTPVLALDGCTNKITVEDASTFNVGDTVLMIQMKGAVIDSTNTASFGNITDYKNAGNYEFNYVKSKTGNIIELKNGLLRQYEIPNGKVQLIRVPYFKSYTASSTLTCLPWDGSKGGVLVLNALDTVTLNANIDVSGKGFRGGKGFNSNTPTLSCFENQYYYPQASNRLAGQKGESIGSPSPNINFGKGNTAGGGGGGQGHNSGGGGGSNGGNGGFGGYSLDACGNAPFDNRGIGGKSFNYTTAINKIFAGSGGGAGQADNPGNSVPDGGNGGGIVIIIANKLINNGNKIIANGNGAATCSVPPSADCHDAMGGGGAAGSVLLSVNILVDNTAIENKGGKGADMVGSVALGGKIGAGGGGSGGLLFVKQNAVPANLTNTNTGGANGVLTQDANNAWGSTPGQTGTTLLNLAIPFTTIPFKPNIDSVRVKDSATTCNSFDFKGFGYTNTNAIANWQWYFGDAATANTQNPSHAYATAGTFPVKLVVTDINGCKDSTTKNVRSSFITMDAGPADTICANNTIVLPATHTGAVSFEWTPTQSLNDPTLLNPIAAPLTTTMFYLKATNADGCSTTDSVKITVRSANNFTVNTPLGLCKNDSIQLLASGGDLYVWQPAANLNNANIANPLAAPQATTPYSVLIRDTLCNSSATLFTTATVLPLPSVKVVKSNDIDCSNPQSVLTATGGAKYLWSPGATLNSTTSNKPIATPTVATKYIVKGTDFNNCSNYDSVTVDITTLNKSGYLMATAFTPNNDGINDCYGIKYWGTIIEVDFSIYNRWGQLIFHTTNPTQCWDGKIKGVLQRTDVFVYMIRAKTICESSVFRKGTFTLIR